ncbi:MAG TPA: RNA 2',3'-cyclic phosphodiesterase [Burkholderiales bacterium]|nr:RNA 2',3'-cyclic phosphodiesterase [Burkholderiales bacterium]
MRLFFASWPPAGVAEALARWAHGAQRDCGGRVTRPETIHLTLAFLGDADPDEARATAAAVRLPGCAFVIEQARYWEHNRIVWAGPHETPPELGRLAQALGETRRYAAHVTLIRKARAPRHLPPVPALEWPVPELLLVGSTLSAEGPSYEVLGRYALR